MTEQKDERLSVIELCNYLNSLAALLDSKGLNELAHRINEASKFASGSPTELFGESKIALMEVRSNVQLDFSESELFKLSLVINQIESEFRRIGGG